VKRVTGIGAMLLSREDENPERRGMTVWALFEKHSKYFEPSRAAFMLNYRVDDLDALLVAFQAEGVEVDPKREDHEYGKFAWIRLWEPPKEG
jgi:hypothetical protein